METFRCKYLKHEKEEIIGFCLNQYCSNATQFCYECLTTNHLDHLIDCTRFCKLSDYINELIQVYYQSSKQFKEISTKLQNCFEKIFKIMDQNIKFLDRMNQQIINKDYLSFKGQISIIKQFHLNEKENKRQLQLGELNNVLETMNNMVRDYNMPYDQNNSCPYRRIKIEEILSVNEDKNQQNIEEAARLFTEGQALSNLNKKHEAIECFNKVILINPQHDNAWKNKGLELYKLDKYQEAIQCYDCAISINPQLYQVWSNKGLALIKLNKQQEAIECYDKAIEIDPLYQNAFNNKGIYFQYYIQAKHYTI
ncbi:unnamed protein product [Paramecium octaurelia]|uniref:Tetratricopeptide repeat protein n=1 Tax=Paramecium octaurelia TaxID=43137 RepID=A0A8S1XZ58_PAROT|nr:unnamed protein product [Paramecium octaurelia]